MNFKPYQRQYSIKAVEVLSIIHVLAKKRLRRDKFDIEIDHIGSRSILTNKEINVWKQEWISCDSLDLLKYEN